MYGYPGQQSGYPGQQQGGYPGQQGGYPPQQQQQQQQQPPPQGYGYGYPQPPQQQQWGPQPPAAMHHPQSHFSPPPGPPPFNPAPNQWQPPPYPPPQGLDQYGNPAHHPPAHHAGGPPPPSEAQQFGHGAPPGYTFQYSTCTGKRKALLIGINYFGQKGELHGCINDVRNVSGFLMERYGYKREDMVVLTDDQADRQSKPTKDNIIRAMQWLVQGAQPNDALFLHYSGHGGQTADVEGDEVDGSNEVIYPVDFNQAGHIEDDVIHKLTVRPLLPGVRLTAIFDSCHSATVMDLPYIYSTKGVLKEPNLAAEAGKGLLGAAMSYARGDVGGAMSGMFGLARTAFKGKGDGAYRKTMDTRTSPADVIMWSGCKDAQTSADATIGAEATGAMSWAFINALRKKPQQTYLELLNSVRDILQTKYSQKPQLSCSHPLDVNLLFVM